MSTNSDLVERIFQFRLVAGKRDGLIAAHIDRALIHLLEYEHDLSKANRQELLAIKGVAITTVDYIQRVIAGEDIIEIAADVHTRPNIRSYRRKKRDH